MPSPNTHRDSFVRYLRNCYPYGEPWLDAWGYHEAIEVKQALKGLKETDPLLFRIIHLYTASHMTRHQVRTRISYDYSTVKRKLDYAVDCILNRLANKDLTVDQLDYLDKRA